MKKVPPTDYAYGIGRIRAMERFLIRQEAFEKAVESDLNEALRIFAEYPSYSADILHIQASEDLEVILQRELSNLKGLIRQLLLDRELFCLIEPGNLDNLCKIVATCQSGFLHDYLMHAMDMHNIKTFLRLYILKEAQDKLRNSIACEGFIKKDDLIDLYAQDLNAFLNKLEYVHKDSQTIDYAYSLRGPIEKTIKERSFVFLEKAISDFLNLVLQPAKYLTFGPEPLLAYYFAKLNEISLVRMVILAKLNNMASTLVSARLNNVYA